MNTAGWSVPPGQAYIKKKNRTTLVNPELQSLIPPLSDVERDRLEESIKKRGCLEPLKVWDGTIVDGHNRYEICRRLNIPFQTQAVEFESRDDAVLYMLEFAAIAAQPASGDAD